MKMKINYKILKRLKKLSVQEIDKILIENKKRINSTNPKGENTYYGFGEWELLSKMWKYKSNSLEAVPDNCTI